MPFNIAVSSNAGSTYSITLNGTSILSGNAVGIHFALFDPTNGTKSITKNYDASSQSSELETFVKDIPSNTVVAIATCGDVSSLSSGAKRACTTLGSYLVHSLNSSSKSWALIGIKGAAPAMAKESLQSGASEVASSLPFQTNEVRTTTIVAKSAGSSAGDYAKVIVSGQTVEIQNGYQRGLNVVVLDENSLTVLDKKVFDTHERDANSQAFVTYMSDLPYGRIVVIAVKYDAAQHLTNLAKQACTAIGSTRINELQTNGSWAIIGYKGARPGTVVEALCNTGTSSQPVECLAALPVNPLLCDGINVIASSATSGSQGSAFVSVGGVKIASGISQGIALAVVEPSTCTFVACQSFDTHTSDTASAALAQFVSTIPVGKIVIGIVYTGAHQHLQNNARRALQQIGSARIWDVSDGFSWAIVGRKGLPPGSVPELVIHNGVATVQLTCKFDTSTLARPYYCLRASSAGMGLGNHAAISVDHIPIAKTERGLNVTILDGTFYKILASESFDTHLYSSESNRFVAFIDQQQNGNVVAIAVKDDAWWHLSAEAKQKITFLGSTEIYNLGYRNSWSMISVKGYEGVVVETLSNDAPAESHMCLPSNGILPLSTHNNQVLLKALSFGSEHGGISSVVKVDESGSHVLGGGSTPGTVTMFSINPLTCQVAHNWSFSTGTSEEASSQLAQAIQGIPSGMVVVAAGCGNITSHLSDEAKQALESVGSGHIRTIGRNDSWVLIGMRGAAPSSVCECLAGNAKGTVCMFLQSTSTSQPPHAAFFVSLMAIGVGLVVGLSVYSIVTSILYTRHHTSIPAVHTPEVSPPPVSPPPTCRPKRVRAMLVGINYTAFHEDERLFDRPPSDARKMKAALVNQNICNELDITLLVDKPWPSHHSTLPSKKNIEKCLRRYITVASDNDVFLFYFFGHGGSNQSIPPEIDPNNPHRQERLKTLDESGRGASALLDTQLNEITKDFPQKCNITYIFQACFSGGMFDDIPELTHPMRGIALTSCNGLIPSIMEYGRPRSHIIDITWIVLQHITNNTSPTYQELYDEIKRRTAENPMTITLRGGAKISVNYEPQMYYDSSSVNPSVAKFLRPFP